jgi:hypothetical protein
MAPGMLRREGGEAAPISTPLWKGEKYDSLSASHPRAREPSQLLPRDRSAQALLRPHNDGLLHSNQKKGAVDEFQAESDTIQILA